MATVHPSEIIEGVLHVHPKVFSDERGMFLETWRSDWFPDKDLMVQNNRADREINSLVGLHYHLQQSDYWYIPFGIARIVLHDLRIGSPTEGATICKDLGTDDRSSHGHEGIYIPPGVAHGFAALTDITITYLVDRFYNPEDELGVAWNDPIIAAEWGVTQPILSIRDQANPQISELDSKIQPAF